MKTTKQDMYDTLKSLLMAIDEEGLLDRSPTLDQAMAAARHMIDGCRDVKCDDRDRREGRVRQRIRRMR